MITDAFLDQKRVNVHEHMVKTTPCGLYCVLKFWTYLCPSWRCLWLSSVRVIPFSWYPHFPFPCGSFRFSQKLWTYREATQVVVHVYLPATQTEQQHLAIGGPLHTSQCAALQLLSPDAVPIYRADDHSSCQVHWLKNNQTQNMTGMYQLLISYHPHTQCRSSVHQSSKPCPSRLTCCGCWSSPRTKSPEKHLT